MSTIAATTIEERASSDTIPVATVVAGTAKVWVVADGSTTVITDSYGVASITDDGAGQITVNFSSDFADANYCAVCTHKHFAQNDAATTVQNIAVGSVQLQTFESGATAVDVGRAMMAIFTAS